MCEARLELEGVAKADQDPVAVFSTVDTSAGFTGPTPARIVAQLAPDPGEVPEGYTVITGEDVTLGLIKSGDWLGIDGRWCLVVGCTSVNGWVTVETAYGYPSISAAFMDARVHLARDVDLEGVEA